MIRKASVVFLLLLPSILILLLAIPLARGRVRRNRLYGFRTPATLASDRVWYAANAAAGKYLVVGGAASVGVTLVAFAALPVIFAIGVSLLGILGGTLLAVGASFRALAHIGE